MSLSCFPDPAHPPDPAALARALGDSATLWARIEVAVDEAHGPVEHVWKHAGKAFGWSLRLVRQGRVLLYLTPRQGHFLGSVVLGGKAAAAALEDPSLPQEVRDALAAARVYAEGRGLRLELGPEADPAPLLRLLAHKLGA